MRPSAPTRRSGLSPKATITGIWRDGAGSGVSALLWDAERGGSGQKVRRNALPPERAHGHNRGRGRNSEQSRRQLCWQYVETKWKSYSCLWASSASRWSWCRGSSAARAAVAVAPTRSRARARREAPALPPRRPPPRAPVATWAPRPPVRRRDGWDDDLGWEGVETAPLRSTREAWERWRDDRVAAGFRGARGRSRRAGAPSCRASSAGARVARRTTSGSRTTTASAGKARTTLRPLSRRWRRQRQRASPRARADAGGDWTRTDEPRARASAPWPRPGRARTSPPARPRRLPASAATDVAPLPEPELGRTYALDDDDWDEPVARPWGAPAADGAARRRSPPRAPRGKRKLHPVLLLAIYAAAGIGLVVLASTVLLGGSTDRAEPRRPRADARARPDGGADARGHRQRRRRPGGRGSRGAAAAPRPKAQPDFRRERTRALARPQATRWTDARAAERASARRAKPRARPQAQQTAQGRAPAAARAAADGSDCRDPAGPAAAPPGDNPAAATRPRRRTRDRRSVSSASAEPAGACPRLDGLPGRDLPGRAAGRRGAHRARRG